MIIKITSSSFAEGEPIPSKYTCDGENISTPLSWEKTPAGTTNSALICDDPGAPVGA